MKQAELVLQEETRIAHPPTVMEMMQQALASGMPGQDGARHQGTGGYPAIAGTVCVGAGNGKPRSTLTAR